ncbi:Chitotriosidase-1 [Orchesella cincta]|uniref:Chitotriosidase-1 n=1 Tax=Orchesella cincta TaxID=48709 RepID=A0A1D2MZ76_ORCCI|nr:Chitotriosidase-1 [Orchesella cincta]
MKLAVILAVCLFGVSTNAKSLRSAPTDCVIDELRPNPDNPHTFYSCTPYGPVLMQCPADLVFSVEANRCANWANMDRPLPMLQSTEAATRRSNH